ADKSCRKESSTRSRSATGPAGYTITNGTASTLRIYWIDYKGKRELWFTLKAGYSQDQDSYRTHPWVVTDEKGRCWRLFYAPTTRTSPPRPASGIGTVPRPANS